MTQLTIGHAATAPAAMQVHLEVSGCDVIVDVGVDSQELRRREERETKPITHLDLLNLLVELPKTSPVPESSYSAYAWRTLQSGSRRGAVSINRVDGRDWVSRLAVPVLDVRHVTVGAGAWRRGLSIASQYAPYSSRDIVLDRLPASEVDLRLEASYLGVGVCARIDGPGAPPRRIVEPAQFRPARYTGASWLFAEKLLGLVPARVL